MDFIFGLPMKKYRHESIFIILDRLIKVSHFILGNTTDDIVIIVRTFIKDIFRLHGFLESIISYRDSKFTSLFWQTLHAEIGTQLNFSSSYHPKCDGKTERVNKILEYILRIFYMEQQHKWEDYLYLIECSYNNAF